MFTDINGKVSSKRVNAFICFVVAGIIGLYSMIIKWNEGYMLIWPFLITGGALLGISIKETVKPENMGDDK